MTTEGVVEQTQPIEIVKSTNADQISNEEPTCEEEPKTTEETKEDVTSVDPNTDIEQDVKETPLDGPEIEPQEVDDPREEPQQNEQQEVPQQVEQQEMQKEIDNTEVQGEQEDLDNTEVQGEQEEQDTTAPQEQKGQGSSSNENVEKFLNQSESKEDIQQFSDDDIIIDADLSSDSSSPSESESDSSSDSDSDSDNDNAQENNEEFDDDEENEVISGPITSKNEDTNETAPHLPEGYSIPENAPIELVGEVTGLVEQSMIIKANISGEFRVLKDESVLCFEDRTIIGPLFETFGRLQQPVYRVKFESPEIMEKFKDSKGKQVFYVVPDSQFIYTDSIKHLKGTDASNCHDEEIPEEEQEFSDDEREAEAKQAKKKKNKNKKTKENDSDPNKAKKRQPDGNNQPSKRFQAYGYAQPPVPQRPAIPEYNPIHNRGESKPYEYKPVNQQTSQTSSHQVTPEMTQASHQSPYGIPFSQAQQAFNLNQHQAYGQVQNPYGQQYVAPQQNQFQPYQQQQYNGYQNQYQQYPPQPYQQQAFPQQYAQQQYPAQHQQQYPAQHQQQPQLQPAQLQQLQQLIVNRLSQQQQQQEQQQNQAPPENQQYPPS